ncbi:MAG: glycosyltransferase [Mogibacterium sp.]|nr:glycosyltransferase [Mogibacterium sp.]
MKETLKVSVILPVYNVEPYIGKCIESLRSQTLKELEFIFVDDKSTDKSISIVEDAAKEDSRIRILYNDENIGPGPSRNRGIEAARGEYLSFVDPDDYLDENYYEVLYNLATEKNADVVKAHVSAVDKDGRTIEGWLDGNKVFKKNAELSKPLFIYIRHEHFSQLFRTSFVNDYPKLRYADTRAGEDSVFLLATTLKNPSIYLCDDTEYYHLIRTDSLEGCISLESCYEGLKALENRIELFKLYSYPEPYEEYLWSTINYYISRFLKYDISQKDEQKKISTRKQYKEKLDAVLAILPDSRLVTDNSKGYKKLTALIEGGGVKEAQKKESDTSQDETRRLRKTARKIIPKSIRKAILNMKKH